MICLAASTAARRLRRTKPRPPTGSQRKLAEKAAQMSRFGTILAIILACSPLARADDDAKPTDEVTEAAAQLTEKNSYRTGITKLRRLTRSKDENTALRAIVALGPELRKHGKHRTLERLLAPYSDPTAENTQYPRIEGLAEFARLTAEKSGVSAAIHLLKRIEDRADVLPTVIIQETFGDCMRTVSEYAKTLKYYKEALAIGEKHFARTETYDQNTGDRTLSMKKPFYDDWLRVKARIESKQKSLKRQLRVLDFGEDFVLYEEGRLLQTEDKLEEALTAFDELVTRFPAGIYAEAAAFYRCLCVENGKAEEVYDELKKFYRKNPRGLYRGEALFEMARIEMLNEGDDRKALRLFDECIDWCETARKDDRTVAAYTIPTKSQEISAPPKAAQAVVQDGKLVVEKTVAANKLVNRLTAPHWYLNRLEREARYNAATCLMFAGKWDKAREKLKRILEIDGELASVHRRGFVNAFHAMNELCRVQRVQYFESELRGISRSDRVRIAYAEVQLRLGHHGVARLAYQELHARALEDDDDDLIALAGFSLASLNYIDGHRTKAEDEMKALVERYPRSRVAPRLHYALGNICGLGPAAYKERFATSIQHFSKAAESSGASRVLKSAAQLGLVIRLAASRQFERAEKVLAGIAGKNRSIAQNEIAYYRKHYQEEN